MSSATVIVMLTLIQSVRLISNENNNTTAELLFSLTNFAIESRQNRYPYPLNLKYQQYYQHQNPNKGQYGLLQYPPNYPQDFGNYPQYQYRPQNQQSIMDVLYSVARNDKLRCVPRLLCELTSDTISRGRQSLTLPSLPLNINMESIIGILSTIDAVSGSPIPVFAKAALLGYISKGNTDSCFSAYPNCPRDADKLVLYLNNYNGGFFRFFNGINPLGIQSGVNNLFNYPLINYPHKSSNLVAEQRIQNKPVQYVPNNYINYANTEKFVFPANHIDSADFSFNRSPKTLTFPRDDVDQFAFRRPKELPFSISSYYSNELDLQRPLPNHKATPMIFPDRTGTGDLRLDPEELNENYQNNNNPAASNQDFYYRPEEEASFNFGYNSNKNNPIFSFPPF